MDKVQWGPRKHFLLFKSRPAIYHVYFTVPYDFNALSAEPSHYETHVHTQPESEGEER